MRNLIGWAAMLAGSVVDSAEQAAAKTKRLVYRAITTSRKD